MLNAFATLCGALALAGVGPNGAETEAVRVKGDYVEARTADVYTGPCFSNSEIFLTGHQAVMAWQVEEGTWDGVDLGGLAVAAAVRGTTTFSQDDPAGARTVLIVDETATPAQREALAAMAKALGGERLSNVVETKVSRIGMFVEHPESPSASEPADEAHAHHQPAARATFWAPGLAEVLTRPLDEGDHVCGNEVVEYQPLSKGVRALPAYTLGNRFSGKGLGTTWNDPNCRSSFVGQFSY